MSTTISHWGNSLGIRIPASIARRAGMAAGRDVTFDVHGENIIIRPADRDGHDIESLIAQITSENQHETMSRIPTELKTIMTNLLEEYTEQQHEKELKRSIRDSKKLDALISDMSATLV